MENTFEKAGIQLSVNSWHYKLIKLVLGGLSPTPQNMHNFCPYFWLLIFSLLTCWFILPIKGLFKLFSFIINKTENFIMKYIILPGVKNWEENLSDFKAYCIYTYEDTIRKSYQNILIENNNENLLGYASNYKSILIIYKWWEKKYNEKAFTKKGSIKIETNKFIEWKNKMRQEYDDIIRQKQIDKKQANIKSVTIKNNVDNFINNITDIVNSWKFIIKWTKRVVGLLITIGGLILTYYVINILSKGSLWIIEHWDWQIFFIIICSIIFGLLLILIFNLLTSWIKLINEKGRKLWYINLIYWPLYILIYWPLRIIIYYLIFKLIVKNLVNVVISGSILFWRSFMSILGIFGKYGNANYSEYCPGIEWVENKK